MSDYEQRFSGIKRLFASEGLERLRRAHVCVLGMGGVGSWAVEALARSGIGRLTLVDLDDVCVSNVNRQLHALEGEIGKPKVEVMARRAGAINPECAVRPMLDFFTLSNADRIFANGFDYVLDAIDHVPNKSFLLAYCRNRSIPVVTTGGAGGRRNPAALRHADLAFSSHDRLLVAVRKKLRAEFGFPADPRKQFEIESVFSTEPVVYPHRDGTVRALREPGSELKLDCQSGYGTASFVTGAFGLMAASLVVRKLISASGFSSA